MKTFIHGPLIMEVPEDWYDQSTVAFAEPPDRSVAEELAKRAAESGAPFQQTDPGLAKPRTNFVIQSRPFPPEENVSEFLANELQAMLGVLPAVKMDPLEWTQVCGADAPMIGIEVTFEEGSALKQLHVLGVADRRLIHFCGTSTPGEFEAAKARFLAMIATIRLGGGDVPPPIYIPPPSAPEEPGKD